LKPLGRGASGEVWLAERDSELVKNRLAIKIPKDPAVDLEAFRQEADIWIRASNHPNVLPVFEANIYDGELVIVSEYAPDGSLEDWLRQQPQRPAWQEAVALAVGILDGLEHLHVRNIIHRDLKPANVLMQSRFPRITDFGFAKLLESPANSQTIRGTPNYMAPESFIGERTVQSDLWSAGVVLFRLLSASLPFQRDNVFELFRAISNDEPAELTTDAPDPIRSAVNRVLQKSPGDRFPSAADMRATLMDGLRRSSAEPSGHDICLKVAITGTANLDPVHTRQRLQKLLAVYCGPRTTWYCGTNGIADEVAAELLLEAQQRVMLVGYHETDISPQMQQIVKGRGIPFLDALSQEVPAIPDAPSKRDIYFTTKADICLVVWNGKSRGTRELLDWLRQSGRDHVIAFVS
jgi:serine/threonine protein kinase